jgi:hypothetical protein
MNPASSAASFEAVVYELNGHLIARLPQAASAALPSRGQVMVKGVINGVAFQTALEPDGRGGHWLDLDDTLRKATNLAAGNTASGTLEATKVWPEPAVPADWQSTLDARPDIKQLWDRVTPMARWEWLRWIGATNNTETRAKRIEVSCSKLTSGLRRPCCFNQSMCCVPEVSKNGVLLPPPTGSTASTAAV